MAERRLTTDEDVQFIFDYVAKILPTYSVPKTFNERLQVELTKMKHFREHYQGSITLEKFKTTPLGWVWDFAAGNMGEFKAGSPLLIGTVYRDDPHRSLVVPKK